jgi:hypothetical protein
MQIRMRGVLHRAVDLVADPRDAWRQAHEVELALKTNDEIIF